MTQRVERRVGRTWRWAALMALAGCGAITETGTELPPDVRDPEETKSASGALAVYNGTRQTFKLAFTKAVANGGLLTDELGSNRYGALIFSQQNDPDRRLLPEVGASDDLYDPLHRVRGQASEAIGLLTRYTPDLSPALRGHAYALAGYAEVLLADLYCSGVPLSTLHFEGDYTLRPGSTTADVYRHALAIYDTALTLAADSARVLQLTQVGRGRVLLALGRYAEAGAAVSGVPDGFSYTVSYDTREPNFMAPYSRSSAVQATTTGATMTDGEGGNGLDYLSSGDPRVAPTRIGTNPYGYPINLPAKYARNGTTPLVVADWVEARLIEAEAALQAADPDTWLAKLNHLRQRAPQVNSAWPVLPDTTDPVDPEARIDLLFRERAFWLHLTGHRQGDLRRLVREYGRSPAAVYPDGLYPDGRGNFGADVNFPVPRLEQELNPHFTGCLHRGA